MGAIIAVLSQVMSLVPQLINLGVDVAPMIANVRKGLDQIGTQVSPDDEEFKKLDAEVKAFEDDFDAAVAERLKDEPAG